MSRGLDWDKARREEALKRPLTGRRTTNSDPTPAQIKFIRELSKAKGVLYRRPATKKDASRQIDELRSLR